MDKKRNLKDLSLPDLERFIATLGKEKYRAGQIMKTIYQQGVASIEEMTTLSKDFRKKLEDIAEISNLEVIRIQSAADETRKILFRLGDGLCIESVVIPGPDGNYLSNNHREIMAVSGIEIEIGNSYIQRSVHRIVTKGVKPSMLPYRSHSQSRPGQAT